MYWIFLDFFQNKIFKENPPLQQSIPIASLLSSLSPENSLKKGQIADLCEKDDNLPLVKQDLLCSHCSFSTSDFSTFKLHQTSAHNEVEKKKIDSIFKCPNCSYCTNRRDALKNHINSHTRQNLYSCPDCQYVTVRKDHLTTHLKSHTGEKPYPCPYCKYSAAQSCTLKRHIRRHTGERPYPCPNCPYTAAQKDHLNTHLKKNGCRFKRGIRRRLNFANYHNRQKSGDTPESNPTLKRAEEPEVKTEYEFSNEKTVKEKEDNFDCDNSPSNDKVIN